MRTAVLTGRRLRLCAAASPRDLVYIGTPGGTSDDSDSGVATGEGLVVLDAKANFALVKRIKLQNLPAAYVLLGPPPSRG